MFGYDNVNDYYDVQLKRDRLEEVLYPIDSFTFHEEGWPDREALNRYFSQEDIEVVINLADQLGFVIITTGTFLVVEKTYLF